MFRLPKESEEEIVSFDFILELVEYEQGDGGERRFVTGRHRIGPAGITGRIVVDDLLTELHHHAIHQRIHLVLARRQRKELLQQRLRLQNILAAEIEEGQFQFRRQRLVLQPITIKME